MANETDIGTLELLDRLEEVLDMPVSIATHVVSYPGRDEITGPVLEILSGEKWISVGQKFWNSWTGQRRRNGEEHHGPIAHLDAPSVVYTGKRTCGCPACETTVEPKFRKN